MKTDKFGNCLLMHGGGLCPTSCYYLSRLAYNLEQEELFNKIFVGRFSFESLIKPEFIKEWKTVRAEAMAKDAPGGYYGTSRGIDLTVPELQEKALRTCRNLGIKWIFVAGGDGSSRQAAEIAPAFEKAGVKIIFPAPLTIDGIEGSASLGKRPAVLKGIKELQNYANTCLMTRDYGQFSVLAFETMGRNRNDVVCGMLKELKYSKKIGNISSDKIDMFAIPANIEWDLERLKARVNPSIRRTLILVSEGANIDKKKLEKILEARKVRWISIAHLFQMNECVDIQEIIEVDRFVRDAMPIIHNGVHTDKSFAICFNPGAEMVEIDYFAKLNPRKDQTVTLSKEDEEILQEFIP